MSKPASLRRKALYRAARLAAGVAAAVVLGVGAASWTLAPGDLLYREQGVLESLSVALWAGSGFASVWAAGRATSRGDRLASAWLGFVALLAVLRELDAHIWLNPVHLGEWGVRYRLDWWLNGDVGPGLKLGWGLAFVTLLALGIFPPMALRRGWSDLVRAADPAAALLLLALVACALGAALDDLWRHSALLTPNARQLTEEVSETIGAALFLTSTVLFWRRPFDRRVRQANQDRAQGLAPEPARAPVTPLPTAPSAPTSPRLRKSRSR